jgi:hypothetical protein
VWGSSAPGPRGTFVGEHIRSVVEKYPQVAVDSYEGSGYVSYIDQMTVSSLGYYYEDNFVTKIQLALFND